MRSFAQSESENKQAPSCAGVPKVRRYIQFGDFHLDIERRELFNNGSRVRVQNKISEALLILAESSGQLVTREALSARLWPGEIQINYDANVNTTVNKLRHVLGDSHERPVYIETIPRMGYKFIANAEIVEQPPFRNTFQHDAQAEIAGNRSPMPRSPFSIVRESWWITAGVVSLFAGALFFGAAVVLFAHRVP